MIPSMSDITDRIEVDALKAQSVSADGVSTSRRSLSELIAADKYLAGRTASTDPAGVLRAMLVQVQPPGGH